MEFSHATFNHCTNFALLGQLACYIKHQARCNPHRHVQLVVACIPYQVIADGRCCERLALCPLMLVNTVTVKAVPPSKLKGLPIFLILHLSVCVCVCGGGERERAWDKAHQHVNAVDLYASMCIHKYACNGAAPMQWCSPYAMVQPLLAVGSIQYTWFVTMWPQPTTSLQSTIKIEKCHLWDLNLGPSSPSRIYASPLLPLGKVLVLESNDRCGSGSQRSHFFKL